MPRRCGLRRHAITNTATRRRRCRAAPAGTESASVASIAHTYHRGRRDLLARESGPPFRARAILLACIMVVMAAGTASAQTGERVSVRVDGRTVLRIGSGDTGDDASERARQIERRIATRFEQPETIGAVRVEQPAADPTSRLLTVSGVPVRCRSRAKTAQEWQMENAQHKLLVGRVLVVVSGAIWIGGLTFYAAAVIPTAHRVLGSHTTVGFITQRVTGWINFAAVIALVVFLLNTLSTRTAGPHRLRIALWAAWTVMAAVQVSLFILHPMLDRLLDAEGFEILDPERFYFLHQIYLIGTSVQLFAGLAFLVCILAAWRQEDVRELEQREWDQQN